MLILMKFDEKYAISNDTHCYFDEDPSVDPKAPPPGQQATQQK